MGMRFGETTVWIMPPGAEPLWQDGRQLFYATEDGSGSVIPLGNCVNVTLDLADPEPPSPDMRRLFRHMLGAHLDD